MFDVQFSFKEIEKKAKMEGKMETTIEIAKKLLRNGLAINVISDSTGLDEEVIERLGLEIDGSAVLS